VPFVFGTTAAAPAMVGSGPDLAKVSKMMMATWVAFARNGDPKNAALPSWPRYTDAGRDAMMLDANSQVVSNPGGQARKALDDLPFYEYSISRTAFMHA
jgi:para-nitrobenzyl esterase